jgi:hypothetical protein
MIKIARLAERFMYMGTTDSQIAPQKGRQIKAHVASCFSCRAIIGNDNCRSSQTPLFLRPRNLVGAKSGESTVRGVMKTLASPDVCCPSPRAQFPRATFLLRAEVSVEQHRGFQPRHSGIPANSRSKCDPEFLQRIEIIAHSVFAMRMPSALPRQALAIHGR